jgi:hypothetical protein
VLTAHDLMLFTPDYDPWAGYEWPDRAGQLERALRKEKADSA